MLHSLHPPPMKTLRQGLLGLAMLAMGCGAQGQTALLTWDVNAINASTTPTFAGTPAAHISGGNLTLGSGTTASSAANTFGGSGFNQTSFASAITANDYISVTITPSAGYSISISGIDYLPGKASAGTVTFAADLTSSKTGYTSSNSLDSYSFTSGSAALRSITLSGIPSLQNITSSIEFRLYGYVVSGAATDTFRIRNLTGNDLVISGTVSAIPEPSTYAAMLGVVALTGVMIHRRRLQRAA